MGKDIRLLVIDFDGTALGGYQPYARFPDHLSSFLDEITERGFHWATCTTWHPYTQEQVFSASLLRSRPIRAIGRTSLACGLYVQKCLYLDAAWDEEMISCKSEFMQKWLTAIRQFLQSCPAVSSLTEYFDYIFALTYQQRSQIEEALNSETLMKEKTYWLFSSTEKQVIIFPWYLSKGLAVKKVARTLGLAPENILVAGDGLNDLPMLEPDVSRHQVCPDNADPQVKERVCANGGVVASLPYADGVIQAVRKMLGESGSKIPT